MASINKINYKYTHEGAKAKRIDCVEQLERSVMSCLLWENEYYEEGVEIAKRIEDLSSIVPIGELKRITLQAKHDMRLRHAPLFLAVQIAKRKDGKAEIASILDNIITRPDDIQEFLALYWKDRRTPIAKQIKKSLGESFRKFDEYSLAKYNGGSKAIKLRDVMRLTHPKPIDENQQELWRKLVKNELSSPDTWEVELSKTTNKKVSWERLLVENKLGGLALLRNIRNINQAGVSETLIKDALKKINAGRLLPINFIASAIYNPQFEPQIEVKFFECFNGEKQQGKTVLLVDVSGSMNEKLSAKSELKRIDVACSLAMIARELYDDIDIFTFSDNVIQVPARRGLALRDAINNSQYHSGTQLGQAINVLTALYHDIRLIVITDEQSRDYVPDVKGYMINVASAKNGVGYGSHWLHINGWSDKVLEYIKSYENR